MQRFAILGYLTLASAMLGLSGGRLAAQAKPAGPDAKELAAVVDKAVAYLKSAQADDGSWSKQVNPGITGPVLTALLRSGKVPANDPVIAKGLKFLETMIDKENGSLAGPDGKARLQNYLTSVNLVAMLEANPKEYAALGEKAVKFLKTMPIDDSRGKDRKDPTYGGVGYDASTRPDMSNTVFFLEALRVAKVPANDPVYAKVLIFVSRSQNLKSEFNDQPWAGKINDGSFIYGAGPAGQKKGTEPDDARPGYGSITASGLISLIDCGVKKEDPRYQKALEWLQKDYTVAKNPGMTDGERGIYMYLSKLAEALDRAGVTTVTDAKKETHDWRADIVAALKARQSEKGSFVNKSPAWLEANPDMATAWALIALSHCKPPAK